MSRRRFAALWLIVAAGSAPPIAARAQATVTVDAADPMYHDVRLLVGEGLVGSEILAHRPYSRRALAAIATGARRRLASMSLDPSRAAVVERALARIERRAMLKQTGDSVTASRVVAPLAAIDADGELLSSASRRVPNGGLWSIDAMTNPLAERREGRGTIDGSPLGLETEHVIEAASWLAIDGRLRAEDDRSPSGGSIVRGRVQTLYARAAYRNAAVELGRQHLAWGPSRVAGLALSDNAPGLDMVRVASDEPFRLPWVFGLAGDVDGQVFVADLGPRYNFPHAKLAGYMLAAQPTQWVSLGIDVLDVVGGKGSPPASFVTKVADFFPFADALFKANYQISNKLAGGYVDLRLPARDSRLYWEVLWDDFDLRRVWSTMWQASAHTFGLAVPRLTSSGALGATVELHHIGLHEYQHGQFTSGLTKDELILGDPLGARGDALYVVLDWLPAAATRVAIDLAGERRDNDEWENVVPNANGSGYKFVKLIERPEEWRHRAVLTLSHDATSRLSIEAQAGVERVTRFEFVPGDDRVNALARLTLRQTF